MFEPSKLFEVVGEPILPLVVKKADPGTNAHLIAWLETKPAAGEYCFNGLGDCLWDQYGKYLLANSRPDAGRSIAYCHAVSLAREVNGWCLNQTSGIAAPKPHTFGAALLRARSFLQAEGGK